MPHGSSNNVRVLLMESDQTLAGVLKYNLSKEGYTVLSAADEAQLLETARIEKPDIILVDLMPAGLTGCGLLQNLCRESSIPILMLASKTEGSSVPGLDIGSDYYVTKPFGVRDLLAKVRAILRKRQASKQGSEITNPATPPLNADSLRMDKKHHTALISGKLLELTPKEFDLLVFLIINTGQAFRREQLLDKVWGYDYAGDTRTIDVHISSLRQKVEQDPKHPLHIITLRGVGYKFEE